VKRTAGEPSTIAIAIIMFVRVRLPKKIRRKMMGEGGTLPPLLVCELAVSGADNDRPRSTLSSRKILIMASDLQSARNVSIVRRQGWGLISNDSV
jgi:hypothetical protein